MLRGGGKFLDREAAIFELFHVGQHRILGLQYGYDGTKYLYLSPFDLFKTGYFGRPTAILIGAAT